MEEQQVRENSEVKNAANSIGIDKLPTIIAISTTVLYVLGFIVVNAYMTTKGITEQSLISSKYISAGVLLLVVSLMFYFFVLKHTDNRARNGVLLNLAWSNIFKIYIHNFYFLEDIFSCCFFSVWVLQIGASSIGTLSLAVVMSTLVAICNLLSDSKTLPIRAIFILKGLLYLLGVTIFHLVGTYEQTLTYLFFSSFVFYCAYVVAATTFENSQKLSSSFGKLLIGLNTGWGQTFVGIYAIIAATIFGAFTYGHITPRFGGGSPPRVEPILAENANEQIKKIFNDANQGIYLLTVSDKTAIFEVDKDGQEKKVIQIPSDQLNGIIYAPVSFGAEYIQQGLKLIEWFKGQHAKSSPKNKS